MRKIGLICLAVIAFSVSGIAGEGTWSERAALSDLFLSVDYSIYEESRIGQDSKEFVSFEGFIHLEYTRKAQSDLSLGYDWRINVTVEYLENTVLQTKVLSIASEEISDFFVYSDYIKLLALDGITGFDVQVRTISGEYYDTGSATWIPVSNPQSDSHFPVDIDFRLELRAVAWYELDITETTSGEFSNLQFDPVNNRVHWSYVEGAEDYDFEWVWIDTRSQEAIDIQNASGNYSYEEPFNLKEPSRVRSWKTNHIIDESYSQGYIYFRLRTVSKFLEANNLGVIDQIKLGEWTYFTTPTSFDPALGSFATGDVVKHLIDVNNEFENEKNWLYGVAYAENGKSVSSLTYYDGSNRGRQSLIYNTSDDITLIGESKFDFEGRQTVNVIPAPVQGRELGYRTDFNLVANGDVFDAEHFDFASYSSPVSQPLTDSYLSSNLGAAQYFSDQNQFTDDLFRAAIPKANGYVYSQTVYMNDGSGRIERIAGIGETFRAGGDHDVKTYYGTPSATELIRLFGSNVHKNPDGYRKDFVMDANGQLSTTYYDKRGNVIATALAGHSPDNLMELEGASEDLYANLLVNNMAINNTLEVQHTITNTVLNNEVILYYDVNSVVNEMLGGTVNVEGVDVTIADLCATCKYDLTIEILDQNENPISETSSNYGKIVSHLMQWILTQLRSVMMKILKVQHLEKT